MTILNLMLGKKRGGLEQAALDYAQGLALAGISNLTVIAPGAWLGAQLASAGAPHESLTCHGNWDILASLRLRALAKRSNATAIICHGNRAIAIATRALKGRIPVIAVAHNYSTRRFAKADACFAITQHGKDHLAAQGIKTISVIPNMVRAPDSLTRAAFRTPPVIGSMGRFVVKKGFKSFIEALCVLRSRGIAFRAVLGGEGEEADALRQLITRYQLQDVVTMSGWVQNKSSFFAALDIFVLPSLHEPFGIVLIEAMSHGLPTISTATEGPREIIHHGTDGLLVPKNDPEALADAMASLINNPARAAKLGSEAAKLVAREYSMQAMAARLKNSLERPYISRMENRSIIAIGGLDRISFLQGILTQDVAKLGHDKIQFAALLSPQGKILNDMFLIRDGERILIDIATSAKELFLRRLAMYKLRAKVTIDDISADLHVSLDANGLPDPRHAELPHRHYSPGKATAENTDSKTLQLGIPELGRDFEPDSVVALDAGYDVLNAVSFTKGCYVGQEITARMHYKNIARRGFYILRNDTMPTRLALLKFEEVEAKGSKVVVDNQTFHASLPAWMGPKLAQFKTARENQ